MSVLIRGMEMPHDCPHCEFAAIGYVSPMSSDCTLYCRAVDKFKDCATAVLENKPYEVINRYNDRPDWCPIEPVVSCNECRYYYKDEDGYEMCDNSEGYDHISADGFCAWAERRLDNG